MAPDVLAPLLVLVVALACMCPASHAQVPTDAFLIDCAKGASDCASILASLAPPAFAVTFGTTKGPFTVHVNTSWAPPMAQRFWTLAQLQYATGGPLYRVLNRNATSRFVAQWGYRAVPAVDGAWISLQTSNATAAVVPPGNAVGTVAFGTSEVPNNGANPNCTAADCSLGFSVELFVNLAENSRLDGADFSPFGWVNQEGMDVLASVYAGYGECADMCAQDPSDTFCVPGRGGIGWAGVNLTQMLLEGRPYLQAGFPLLDYITSVAVAVEEGEG